MSKNTTLVILLGVLALLSCREDRQDGQLLGSIEQVWQLCEVSLPEAEARAEMLEDSVQKASELVRQRYSLLTILQTLGILSSSSVCLISCLLVLLIRYRSTTRLLELQRLPLRCTLILAITSTTLVLVT